MSSFFKASLVAVSLVTLTGAVQYPYNFHQEQNIDDHQVGWIDVKIDAQGRGTLTHSWSNGKRTSGNTFYSVVIFANKDGKVVYADKQTKGLDGSWYGPAREGRVTTQLRLTKEQMDEFDHIELKMGAMYCGLELSSFRCCDHGIEVGFTTRRCGR
jgi:hypothetical protein